MVKRIGAVLLVLGLLLGCVGSALGAEPESVIVQVSSGNLKGSGVIYQKNDDSLIVVTAAHVLVQGSEAVSVIFSDASEVTTADYYISNHSDLAFVNIPLSVLSEIKQRKYIPVQIDKSAFDGLQGGDEVVFQGSVGATDVPYTGTVWENWIFAEDFGQYMMILQGDVEPGMSGGGVFDTAGNFLGIICGESEIGEVAALPLSIIEAEYLGVY